MTGVGTDALLPESGAHPSRRARPGLWQWLCDEVFEPVLSVAFPPRCVGCGEFEVYLCERCRSDLAAIWVDCCRRCGEPGVHPRVAGRCSACMGRELEYVGARSAFLHRGVAQELVTRFKSGAQPVLGRVMADLAREALVEFSSSIAPSEEILVTWVPSHKASTRRRGYNQAEILARRLADALPGLSCCQLTVKNRATRQQKGLGRAERTGNLRDAFSTSPDLERRIAGSGASSRAGWPSAVVLVDDVYTTGATAAAVSSVMASATGLPVYVFTFSRAVSGVVEGHD